MDRTIISPETVHKPTTYYSHAMQVGDVIYTAGQAPHVFSGEVWPKTDPAGQVRCAFENMQTILKACDAHFEDIVRLNVLVRNAEVIPVFWEVAQKYLGDNQPAVTMAVVKGLAGPEYLLEFDSIVSKA